MKRYLSALLILCLLCALPALAEESDSPVEAPSEVAEAPSEALEAPVEESVFELDGGDSEDKKEEEKVEVEIIEEETSPGGSDSSYIIPYPDVTSSEIRKLLKPSKKVYPGKLVWPLPGTPVLGHITSHVGWRNAARIHRHQGGAWPSWLHHGIDVGKVTTSQQVVAAAGGKAWAGQRRGDGKYVVIDHGNGWYTEYQHLSAFAGDVYKGCKGIKVAAGDPIGYVGNSGGDYPVHFHFEIVWSPNGPGASGRKYFKQTKNRTIRAYSFEQESVVALHWAKTWEICTAEKQHFVASVEELEEEEGKSAEEP